MFNGFIYVSLQRKEANMPIYCYKKELRVAQHDTTATCRILFTRGCLDIIFFSIHLNIRTYSSLWKQQMFGHNISKNLIFNLKLKKILLYLENLKRNLNFIEVQTRSNIRNLIKKKIFQLKKGFWGVAHRGFYYSITIQA